MAHYLVTGGGGFIGSNIVAELVRRGHRVRVLDNFSTGRRENLTMFEKEIEILEGDIRSYPTVERALQGIDHVLHQAALPSVPRSVADPSTTNDVNVNGTLNVLLASRQASARSVVIASSSSVYGDTAESPKRENMPPSPLSPYAVSKLTTEYYGRVFHSLYGLPVVILRYFNVFGENQNPDSQYSAVIPKFAKALLHGSVATIYGDGGQSRDFTHVENVVWANIAASTSQEAAGHVMNIAAGGSISVMELYQRLSAILAVDRKPEFVAPRAGEVRNSFADIAVARRLLGYKVVCDFEHGLKRTAEHFKAIFKP